MLSPISWRTPPKHYGAWEYVVSNLTEELIQLGVDVTLFATQDSLTKGKLHAVCPKGYSENPNMDRKVCECLHISEVFERADNFDIIHNHFDFLPLTYSKLVDTPVVTTVHGFSSKKILMVYQKYRDLPYVSISHSSRIEGLNYVANIYHGINLKQFPFQSDPENYLIFLGRISRDKGVHQAIQVALKSKIPLVIAGIIDGISYYQKWVEPFVDGDKVLFYGPVGPVKKAELLGNAYAYLHLSTIPEPFSLSVIESLACGTPVIGVNKGAIPEIINDKCGFIVDTIEQAIDAVKKVNTIKRLNCRRRAEIKFSAEKMAKEYHKIYYRIVENKFSSQSNIDSICK
jgi:glycosyltransferase involved in cell wall biosynthesis